METLPKSLQIIRSQHQFIARVLTSMRRTIHDGPGNMPERFFDMMRSMLFYLDEFPERMHHAHETKVLFPRLKLRTDTVSHLIDQLNAEHQLCENIIKQLQHSLLAWEIMGESRRRSFEFEALQFIERYFEHMRLEEKEILPVVVSSFLPEDWKLMDDAFTAHVGMRDSGAHDSGYARLLTRIMIHGQSESI
jgi:hemerythrin-like domain-containing protein